MTVERFLALSTESRLNANKPGTQHQRHKRLNQFPFQRQIALAGAIGPSDRAWMIAVRVVRNIGARALIVEHGCECCVGRDRGVYVSQHRHGA